MNRIFVALAAALAAALFAHGSSAAPSKEEKGVSKYEQTMRLRNRLRTEMSIGDVYWVDRAKSQLKRSQLETSAEYAARVKARISRKETAVVLGQSGGQEPEHFLYDADREVLQIKVSLGRFPLSAVGTVRPYQEHLEGECFATFTRGLNGDMRSSVSSTFAFTNLKQPCEGEQRALFTQAVPVPISEMREAMGRLVWELDLTPSPMRDGELTGTTVLELTSMKLYTSATLVHLHEVRLIDAETRKIYFRALIG